MRIQNWESELIHYITCVQEGSITFQPWQCADFVANAAYSCTCAMELLDRNVVPFIKSGLQAQRLLKKKSLRQRVTEILGQEIMVSMAQRGDIVLLEQDGWPALGVCMGEHAFFLSSENRLEMRPTLACQAAWRVE